MVLLLDQVAATAKEGATEAQAEAQASTSSIQSALDAERVGRAEDAEGHRTECAETAARMRGLQEQRGVCVCVLCRACTCGCLTRGACSNSPARPPPPVHTTAPPTPPDATKAALSAEREVTQQLSADVEASCQDQPLPTIRRILELADPGNSHPWRGLIERRDISNLGRPVEKDMTSAVTDWLRLIKVIVSVMLGLLAFGCENLKERAKEEIVNQCSATVTDPWSGSPPLYSATSSGRGSSSRRASPTARSATASSPSSPSAETLV